MNSELEQKIKAIFEEYPELKNSQVDFNESSFSISKKMALSISKLPICEQEEQGPDSFSGTSQKIEARKSGVHGYGVFAKETIEAGELIEENKLLKLSLRNNYMHDSVIQDYAWGDKNCNCEDCKKHGNYLYLGFGYISLYNHSDQPNTKQQLDFRTKSYQVHARTRIEKGSEIFVTYGQKYWLIRDFWKHVHKTDGIEKFHKANIQPKIKD